MKLDPSSVCSPTTIEVFRKFFLFLRKIPRGISPLTRPDFSSGTGLAIQLPKVESLPRPAKPGDITFKVLN